MEADYVVRVRNRWGHESGFQRLIGEYFKHGHNHNRDTYKKKDEQIILYY